MLKTLVSLLILVSLCLPAVAAETRVSHSPPISFASFGYFVDKLELPLGTRGQIWATPRSVYEGPFHANDQLRIYLPPEYFDTIPQPFFRGPVSTSASSIKYYKNFGPFDDSGNVDEKKMGMIFQGKVDLGVKPIPLPPHPAGLARDGALGGADLSGIPEGELVFLPHNVQNKLTGGIVVAGSLREMRFEAKEREPFKIALMGNDRKETIVEVEGGETIVHQPDNSEKKYEGVPNGAIYVNGDIGSRSEGGIHGTVKGRWTVACEGDVYVDGNLEYSDTPEGNEPVGEDDLALIARDVFISSKAPNLLYLYATVFAAKKEGNAMVGALFVLPSADRDVPRQGELFWWGNYIGEYPAIMGTFDRSTGEAKDGYDLQKYYDARLASDPPPFFPVMAEK